MTHTPAIDYSGDCPQCGRVAAVLPDGRIPPHDVYGLASECDAPPMLLAAAVDAAGYPPPGHEPPTAAEWYEPEGAQP